jgi:hypothetical protein
MFLDICKFLTVDFMYFVYPCPFETSRGSIFICGFSILCLLFVLLRQKGKYFIFYFLCLLVLLASFC